MAQGHEDASAELHGAMNVDRLNRNGSTDLSGAPLEVPNDYKDEKDLTLGKATSDDTSDDDRYREDGDEPSMQERLSLRRIGDSMPLATWLVAVVELCERFTYYGCQGLFQNYITITYGGNEGNGGLGMGAQAATGLNTFFQFWCYVTPIPGAIIADQYLGRYNTIILFSVVYIIGLLILWVTALPTSLENGAGLGGFITALIVIGIGTGGIKSNVAPLIADQYQRRRMALKTLASGERVIIDPAVTMQRIYMVFYWCINVGALSLLATPYMEQFIGFWSAYLLAFCMFLVGFATLILARKKYVVRPPTGSIITNAFKAMFQMIIGRSQDAPKPSYRAARGLAIKGNWDDHFIDEVKRALIACRIFVFYPVFWVCYGQFSTNFVTQASQMDGHGIPNDLMQNFDPIAIIVTIPLLDRLIYPQLRKVGIKMRPVTRITIGFVVAGLGMAYAAIVQHLIYSAGPCYESPLNCAAAQPPAGSNAETATNNVHIAVQVPAYMLIGVSEIFISVTGLEYAYTKAPPTMKSFVQSMYLLTNAFGSAISTAFVSVALDPKYLWLYTGLACASVTTGAIFWFTFKHLNAQEEELNELDKNEPVLKGRGGVEEGESQNHVGPGPRANSQVNAPPGYEADQK